MSFPGFKKRSNGRFCNKEDEYHSCSPFGLLNLAFKLFARGLGSYKSHKKDWLFCDGRAIENWLIKKTLNGVTYSWLGHSTFLIDIAGRRVLTDPVFWGIGKPFRRILPLPIRPEAIVGVDVVLISHNHRDHMDIPSLRLINRINPGVVFLVPHGDSKYLLATGIERVQEFYWGDDFKLSGVGSEGAELVLEFLPAWHWSQRRTFDRNKSLWGSWLLSSDEASIYFAGDSAYAQHFREIGATKKGAPIDVALLPIGPTEPREIMKHSHLDSFEALQAFLDLGAVSFVPMHWGTFPFGNDTPEEPIVFLSRLWRMMKHELVSKQLIPSPVGKPLVLSPVEVASPKRISHLTTFLNGIESD